MTHDIIREVYREVVGYEMTDHQFAQAVPFLKKLFEHMEVVGYRDDTGAVALEEYELLGENIQPLIVKPEI